MSTLQGLGLEFQETMSGWLGIGKEDYVAGRITGEQENTPLRFDAKIIIDDLERFINLADHQARLEGSVTFPPLGGTFAMEDGLFNLFSIDTEGVRHMNYSFRFTAGTGQKYFLSGHKNIKDDPGFDVIEDMTTLFTKVYEGADETAPCYGSGQVFFELKNAPALLASMKVTGADWWQLHKKIQAKAAFMDFAWGKIRQEYLRDVNPLYDTEYENLVLSGQVEQNGATQDFFLVSGIHDRDFPWGDGEIFWDVLLIMGNRATGYKRYAITDRFLEGLQLNVQEGSYRYQGPIYELTEGFATSWSHMRQKKATLAEWAADFQIDFTARPYDITPFPFPIANHVLAKMASGIKWMLRGMLPAEHLLGIFITPHTVTVHHGTLTLNRAGRSTAHPIVTEN